MVLSLFIRCYNILYDVSPAYYYTDQNGKRDKLFTHFIRQKIRKI